MDISKIKAPNGTIYNIKDLEARKGLKELLGDDYGEEDVQEENLEEESSNT